MRLSALRDDGDVVRGRADLDPDVLGLTADSRAVRPGFLFAALEGVRRDGRDFIPDALTGGAAALLVGSGFTADGLPVPVVLDPEPRRGLARMAARFFVRQPKTSVAVTGTSGKTSVAGFVRQLFALEGLPSASLGTLGVIVENAEAPPGTPGYGLTTPDPVELHRTLAALAAAGVEHAALEASSHGLDQFRLDGLRLRAAAFTNLSRDHLDYHADAAAYLGAKTRLFTELLPRGAAAVLNADRPEVAALAAPLRARGLEVMSVGRAGETARLVEREEGTASQRLRIELFGRMYDAETPLLGAFQADNLLCALALAVAAGLDPGVGVANLGKLRAAPGRLEPIGVHPSGAPVFVDYAHKPDALDNVLRVLRPIARRRLVVVFGCGGDRDRGKRAEMGRIAADRADAVVVTDDNPRSEDPAAIRAAILEAAPAAVEIGDRAAAIRHAVGGLEPGDVLVIAGKGHETGQIVGNAVLPFDDSAEALRAIAAAEGAT